MVKGSKCTKFQMPIVFRLVRGPGQTNKQINRHIDIQPNIRVSTYIKSSCENSGNKNTPNNNHQIIFHKVFTLNQLFTRKTLNKIAVIQVDTEDFTFFTVMPTVFIKTKHFVTQNIKDKSAGE